MTDQNDTPPVETPPAEATTGSPKPWGNPQTSDKPEPSAADLAAHAGTDPQADPVRPLEELTTPSPETTPDEEPGVFVVGDQTAAGYLTPEGARNPGIGTKTNPLDPYNVNNGNHAYHQAVRDNASRGTQRHLLRDRDMDASAADAPSEEPPAGTPLTPEERAANGLPPLDETEQPAI